MTHAVSHAKTLVDVIHYWASERPTQEALRFYPQGEGEYISLTFAELHARCQIIASHLAPYHGKPALLLFNSGLNFLEALFACFYAGVIAVPAYPPRKNHHITRLSALIDDCQPAIVLSESAISTQSKHLFAQANNTQITQLPWLDADLTTQKTNTLFHPANENDLAFLQYTSGSTGKPKGVMLSHKNLMSNIRMAQKAFNLPSNARCVSWLPLFHDMGLIGSVMAPLYWGAGSVLMPPAAFLQKPLRWLKLLSEFGQYSPVGCTAPNFSYQLCVDSISDEQAAELDLSAWIFALSGAEPVRAQTLDAFAEKFAVSGFTKNAFVPAYGMAECSVLSTCRQNTPIRYITVDSHALAENNIMLSADSNLTLVSCGQSCAPQILKIVQSDTLVELAEGQVGEIWLQGEHIGQGYWQQAPRSQATFHAYTAANEGPFLRTGDLGCLIDGELFVTGRIKDLLIIRGKNYYPQDIEYTAMHAFTGLQLEHTAAFTIEQDGEENLFLCKNLAAMRSATLTLTTQAKPLAKPSRVNTVSMYTPLPLFVLPVSIKPAAARSNAMRVKTRF